MKKLLDKMDEFTALVWVAGATLAALAGLIADDVMLIICAMLAYLCAHAK